MVGKGRPMIVRVCRLVWDTWETQMLVHLRYNTLKGLGQNVKGKCRRVVPAWRAALRKKTVVTMPKVSTTVVTFMWCFRFTLLFTCGRIFFSCAAALAHATSATIATASGRTIIYSLHDGYVLRL